MALCCKQTNSTMTNSVNAVLCCSAADLMPSVAMFRVSARCYKRPDHSVTNSFATLCCSGELNNCWSLQQCFGSKGNSRIFLQALCTKLLAQSAYAYPVGLVTEDSSKVACTIDKHRGKKVVVFIRKPVLQTGLMLHEIWHWAKFLAGAVVFCQNGSDQKVKCRQTITFDINEHNRLLDIDIAPNFHDYLCLCSLTQALS